MVQGVVGMLKGAVYLCDTKVWLLAKVGFASNGRNNACERLL